MSLRQLSRSSTVGVMSVLVVALTLATTLAHLNGQASPVAITRVVVSSDNSTLLIIGTNLGTTPTGLSTAPTVIVGGQPLTVSGVTFDQTAVWAALPPGMLGLRVGCREMSSGGCWESTQGASGFRNLVAQGADRRRASRNARLTSLRQGYGGPP